MKIPLAVLIGNVKPIDRITDQGESDALNVSAGKKRVSQQSLSKRLICCLIALGRRELREVKIDRRHEGKETGEAKLARATTSWNNLSIGMVGPRRHSV